MREAIFIAAAGCLLSAVFCAALIPLLKKLHAGQYILGYVEEHKAKSGTPTMGGLAFVFAAACVAAVAGLFSDRLSLICGDLTEKVEGAYDIVCANIVADVIIRLSKDIRSYMKSGSVLLCSGIIEPREQEVLDALSRCGLDHVTTLREKGWIAAAFLLR